MSEFTGPFEESDAALLELQATEQFESVFEGWAPAAGDPELWLTKAFSRIGSQVFDQATLLVTGAFQRFGEAVVGVPPIQAAPATAASTWTMVDNAGYTIPQGTQLTIASTGEEAFGFVTSEEVTVAPGSTTTTIQLEAVEPGEAGNDLSSDPNLVDALAFVSGVELEGETANGVDDEDEDAYLSRLVEALRNLSLSLIVGADFERDARAVAGIARAKCIEAYNAAETKEEALSVSVYPIDVAGKALSTKVKEALQERQQAKVPSGINVHVADPAYQKIDVSSTVVVKAGFDPATVKASVESFLNEYLSPATYGIPQSGDESGGGWINNPTIYLNELISGIDRVGGVERVTIVKQAKHSAGLTAADVVLSAGKVALPEAGTLTITAA